MMPVQRFFCFIHVGGNTGTHSIPSPALYYDLIHDCCHITASLASFARVRGKEGLALQTRSLHDS
jgi:hypothetical protein